MESALEKTKIPLLFLSVHWVKWKQFTEYDPDPTARVSESFRLIQMMLFRLIVHYKGIGHAFTCT